MYKKIDENTVLRISDNTFITIDSTSPDAECVKYVAWVASGGVVQPIDIDQVKKDQISALTLQYNAAIQQPVAYMATTFQADAYSQSEMTKKLVAGSVPPGFFWLDSNNVQVPMTFTELQGLSAAMSAQGQSAFAKLQGLKAQVCAAATVEEVGLVVW